MKPDRHDWFRVGGALSQPRDYSAESIPPPEIVGEVTNPVLEMSRRLWWRALDGVCYCIVLIRLSIHDRIYGPEPPISADLEPEADYDWLVTAFPVAGEAIERQNTPPA
jgi:hypothetical protein